MATITSNGPSPIPKLNEIAASTLESERNLASNPEMLIKLDELIEAVKEITSR